MRDAKDGDEEGRVKKKANVGKERRRESLLVKREKREKGQKERGARNKLAR